MEVRHHHKHGAARKDCLEFHGNGFLPPPQEAAVRIVAEALDDAVVSIAAEILGDAGQLLAAESGIYPEQEFDVTPADKVENRGSDGVLQLCDRIETGFGTEPIDLGNKLLRKGIDRGAI